MDGNAATHFHIRWILGDSSRVDWEVFASRDDALKTAKRLASLTETYAIEEFYDSCQRCAMFRLERKISRSASA